jgi:hypothetical protein
MANPFTDHPNAVGESYFDHLGQASGIGGQMILGGLACLMHGLFPFLFTKTGSNVILRLASKCGQRRHLMAQAEAAAAPMVAGRS